MSYENIKDDILTFQEKVKTWQTEELEDEEVEEINVLLDETMALISGDDDEEMDEEDDL